MRHFNDPLTLNPGELRHTVQVQQQGTEQTATGAPVDAWSTVLTAVAAIATLSSREVYQASQFTAEVSHVITIRWPGSSVTIQGGQRVVFGSRFFKLQTVENVLERNRVLRLHCLEINGQQ